MSRFPTISNLGTMFTVVPLVPQYDNAISSVARIHKQRHHPDVQGDVDMELDEIDEDENGSSSKVTSPGEAIASSAAVLRCDLSVFVRLYTSSELVVIS